MNGKELLVDTNILIYLLNGDNTIADFLQGKSIFLSFITELELLGLKNISETELQKIKSLINDCFIVPLNDDIKNKYFLLRQQTNLKLADSLIAATSLHLNVPFFTADNDFRKVNDLLLMIYQK